MDQKRQLSSNLGSISILGAGFFYALYSVFSRIIGPVFATFYQTWSRGLIVLAFFLVVGLITRAYQPIKREHLKWFLIISLSAAFTTAPYYIAILNISFGTTMFSFYAVSLITSIILGALFFQERLSSIKIIAFALALIGMALLFIDSIALYAPKFIFAAALSGFFYSICSVFTKKVSSIYSNIHISTYNTGVIVLVNLLFSLIFKEFWYTQFFSVYWLTNIAYAFATICTMVLVIYGFKRIEAQLASLLLLSELPFVILFGWLFYKEIPAFMTIFGGFLIIIAMALPNLNRFNKNPN